jgi:hypothetical protein
MLPSLPERAEWRLDGRALALSLPLATPAAELKALLQRSTNMPTAKQKLHYEVRARAILVTTSRNRNSHVT